MIIEKFNEHNTKIKIKKKDKIINLSHPLDRKRN